jgi:putative transposase
MWFVVAPLQYTHTVLWHSIQQMFYMPQSYCVLWFHVIWTTKYRKRQITRRIKYPLFQKMREIAKEKNYQLDFVNGVEDHVHLLVRLKSTQTVCRFVQDIKGITHTWLHNSDLNDPDDLFHWQDGYSAFTVSPDRVSRTRNYIRNQEKHHSKRSTDEELDDLNKWL